MLPMKRIFLLIVPLLLLFPAFSPTAAQSSDPLDWIPADFTGFVHLDMTEPQTTIENLNVSLFVASALQPVRFQYEQAPTYADFFPLADFDTENASFTQLILPWLKDELVIAYRQLGSQFNAAPEDTLLILPTRDTFQSASSLQSVIQAQDLGTREPYHDINIYNGDKTSFAFLPTAVLVGAEDLLHAAIDTMRGEGTALTANPVYQQVSAALPQTGVISAYVTDPAAARALSVLLSGSDAAEPVLTALDTLLPTQETSQNPEHLLLSGSVDGIGVNLHYDRLRPSNLQADVILHTTSASALETAAFDASVLEFVPRNAMLVQSGANAHSTATTALYAVPFFNFASQTLASFTVTQPSGVALPMPTADDVQVALDGFLSAVAPVVNVQEDLIDQLNGTYSLALLPRPNNVLPGTNLPFDLLIVAQTADAEGAATAQRSAATLLETFGVALETESLDDHAFQTLRTSDTGETLISVGAVDNIFIVGTGLAAQMALEARNGDNQLIQQARWQNLTANEEIPYLYVDVNAFYNTFIPSNGGPAVRGLSQLGVQSRDLGENLLQLHLYVGVN